MTTISGTIGPGGVKMRTTRYGKPMASFSVGEEHTPDTTLTGWAAVEAERPKTWTRVVAFGHVVSDLEPLRPGDYIGLEGDYSDNPDFAAFVASGIWE